jgi:hypothetical protein
MSALEPDVSSLLTVEADGDGGITMSAEILDDLYKIYGYNGFYVLGNKLFDLVAERNKKPEEAWPEIMAHYDPPPIPDRRFDWCATFEDYDGAPDAGQQAIGFGTTRDEAVKDLLASRAEIDDG